MVSSVRLILVLGFAAVWILGAAVVAVRWWWRARKARRITGTDSERRFRVGVRARPARSHAGVEWAIVIIGIGFAGCIAWGLVEPHTIAVTYHQVRSPKLAGAKLRIVQLSDIHSEAEAFNEERIVSTVKRLNPDLIVFTGDALNEARGLAVFRQTMTELAQIAPTYSVKGNWETWWFPDLDLYSRTGVHPIDGQAQPVSVRRQTIWIAGVGVDRESALPRAMHRAPASGFVLLLAHFPFAAVKAAALGVDLMLAGDTHGGQVNLPVLGELVRIRRHGVWRKAGLSQERNMWLYVNRGLGNEAHLPRFRFNCPPEIAVFDLEPQQ